MTDVATPLPYNTYDRSSPSNASFSTTNEEVEPLESLGYNLLQQNTELKILIEIIGLTDLKDINERRILSSKEYKSLSNVTPTKKKQCNSYCTISYDTKLIHKTQTIRNDNNPIYDIGTNSMCLFHTTAKDFMSNEAGLVFSVYDELDSMTSKLTSNRGELLGQVVLTPKDILTNCNESRLEYSISHDTNKILNLHTNGKLALRFRLATEYDIEFLSKLNKKLLFQEQTRSNMHLISNRTAPSFTSQMKSLTNVLNPNMINESLTKIKIKPYPEPKNKERTTFMTKEEIQSTYKNPSTNWIETGSKKESLGKIYLEILKCNNLPNMDVGGVMGNLTDSFLCCIHEDSILETDVINDELDPIWMPWTKRAFIFNIKHPLSPLYISVFDHDLGPLGHEGIGRVVLNLNNFYNGLENVLTFRLYNTDNLWERKESFGSVTIRLRVVIEDERRYLLASNSIPPKFHVNVSHETSLNVIRYALYGKYTNDTFDLQVMKSYVWEFFHYKDMISYYTSDAIYSLIFWKGNQVELFGYNLPLHSAIAFIAGVNLVENLHLVLPCFFFCIGWMMIANKLTRNVHPSPWYQTKTFLYYLQILLGMQPCSRSIRYQENKEQAEQFIKQWEDRLQNDLNKSNQVYELQLQLDNIANEVIETKTEGNKFDMYNQLAPIALRMQKRLSGYCYICRKIKSVLNWDESILSFWITLYSLSLGMVCLILPWTTILHWTLRLSIWTFLGPWMIVVDKYLLTKEVDIVENFNKEKLVARLKGEDNIKRKALRKLIYGDYSASIPSRNVAMFYDVPLYESTSEPKEMSECRVGTYIPGQFLDGNMILRRFDDEHQFKMEKSNWEKCKFKLSALQCIAGTKLLNDKIATASPPRQKTSPKVKSPKRNITKAIKEDEIYDDGIEVYGTICNTNTNNYEKSYDMIQYGAELEIIPRNDDKIIEASNEIIHKMEQYNNRCDELIEKANYMIHSTPSWVTTSTYHDARDEDEIEEQGLEIISYHQIGDGHVQHYENGFNDDDSLEGKIIQRTNSDVSSLSCLYHSPASPDVDIAFYKKNK